MPDQTQGRTDNAARPGDPSRSEADKIETGKAGTQSAGPDGPDAAEVGDTFKQRPRAHAGAAEGVGSVAPDDDGAFDVGSPDPDENERKAPG